MIQSAWAKLHDKLSSRSKHSTKPNSAMSRSSHILDVPTKKATLAMACFWAPDALFGATLGVVRTRVGYSGGSFANPTYKNLGDHTESIDIDYDPNVLSYNRILELFWANHDPTAKLKKQYTSIIFYHDEEQKTAAEESLKAESAKHAAPLVTTVVPASTFYNAEQYHQKYRLQQHSWLCQHIGLTADPSLILDSTLAARLNGYVIGCGGLAQFQQDLPNLQLDDKAADYVRNLVKKFEGHGLVC